MIENIFLICFTSFIFGLIICYWGRYSLHSLVLVGLLGAYFDVVILIRHTNDAIKAWWSPLWFLIFPWGGLGIFCGYKLYDYVESNCRILNEK